MSRCVCHIVIVKCGKRICMAAHLRRDSLPPPFLMSNYEEFWDGGNILPNYVTARGAIQ